MKIAKEITKYYPVCLKHSNELSKEAIKILNINEDTDENKWNDDIYNQVKEKTLELIEPTIRQYIKDNSIENESRIIYDENPIDGVIRMLKVITNKRTIKDNERFKSFCKNLRGIAFGATHKSKYIEHDNKSIEDILNLPYNSELSVRFKLHELQKELACYIAIQDVTSCSSINGDCLYFDKELFENKTKGAAIAYFCKKKTEESDEFIKDLLEHIAYFKPLCVRREQLPSVIVELENAKQETKELPAGLTDSRYPYGIGIEDIEKNFYNIVVLENQNFMFADAKVGDLLKKHGITIIDYNYI